MYDAVIVGAGGAGLAAATSLIKYTHNFMIITAGGLGHCNTIKAHGGIQIPVLPEDNEELHFQDTFVGGNQKGKKELIRLMTENTKNILSWINYLGLDFDKKDDVYIVKNCEGITIPRVLSKGGHIGASIIKILYKEIKKNSIVIRRHSVLKKITKGKDFFTLKIASNNGYFEVDTKRVILCCGGRSRQFAALNRYGTTNQPITDSQFYESLKALNIEMIDEESFQFHPTCITLKGSLYGLPVPETLRSFDAILYDGKGRIIQSHGVTRDMLTKMMFDAMEEKRAYIDERLGNESFFLDLRPAFEHKGAVIDTFKWFLNRLRKGGLDPLKDYLPVCPMVHYQNGGIKIDMKCETSVSGIYAAGEITGGIHGTNRLMGNSLLDILTFGKIAGESCGKSIEQEDRL